MSQGLKVTEFPEVTNNQLDNRDFFLVSEFVRENIYATKKLSAKYITNLRTEAVNLAAADKLDKEIYAGIQTGSNGQNILKFRTLKAGSDINIDLPSSASESLIINSLIDGSNLTSQADNNATIFFKKESSLLKFKSIVGEQGILTRSDNNKVYIRPKEHHYFFIPGDTSNPSNNKKIFSIYSGTVGGSTGSFTNRTTSGTWSTGTQTASLASIINNSPVVVRDAISAADKGLAFVRMYLNTNSGGNVGHSLSVKSTEDTSWTTKISIDPTGGGGTAWEGEDTCSTIIEFNKKAGSAFGNFNWKMDVGSTSRSRSWEFTVGMVLEGFFV